MSARDDVIGKKSYCFTFLLRADTGVCPYMGAPGLHELDEFLNSDVKNDGAERQMKNEEFV